MSRKKKNPKNNSGLGDRDHAIVVVRALSPKNERPKPSLDYVEKKPERPPTEAQRRQGAERRAQQDRDLRQEYGTERYWGDHG